MKKTLTFFTLFMLLTAAVFAQSYRITGKITDKNGEALVGANVVMIGHNLGAVTNFTGDYTITNVPKGNYNVKASFMGYEAVTKNVNLTGNVVINFQLKSSSIMMESAIVEVTRAKERETPIAFTEVGKKELEAKYNVQDVPDLLKTVPGVFTTSAGMGESEIFIRGFDAEHIQILINGVPVNDPESQKVYWSNWTGLSGNASSIQVQRGVGASLVGSGAFGGSVNIQTSMYSATPQLRIRATTGMYHTVGIDGGALDGKSADGTGGFQTTHPAAQNYGIEYTTGQMYDGKLNVMMKYERKAGDSFVNGTYYNGHSFYLGVQSLLGDHVLTFNAHGAPQRHNQARTSQDMELIKTLGWEYNRNNTPYQENYYFKPQFEIHHDWSISKTQHLNTNVFFTTGNGGGRYLRNDSFNTATGEISRKSVSNYTDAKYMGRHAKYVYDKTGVVLTGYDAVNETFTFNGETSNVSKGTNFINGNYNHSWRNDSQNNHVQFGFNTAYTHKINDMISFAVGGEYRYWNAEHIAESFDLSLADEDGNMTFYRQIEDRYNYDGIVTNLSGFARLLISPIKDLTIMLDGQYAYYTSKVEENQIRIFDFAAGQFTNNYYYATKGGSYNEDDYERTYKFFQPKFGVNYNINKNLNVFANYSIAKKEPKIGDWYSRSSGPVREVDEETVKNIEFGIGYRTSNFSINANAYQLDFEDKIASVTNQAGDRETINAGNAIHKGIEIAAAAQVKQFDANVSITVSQNRWDEMKVQKIFNLDAEEVKDNVVPFSPENMYHAAIGYRAFKGFRIEVNASAWNRYYGDYANEVTLPNFFELNTSISYGFMMSGNQIDLRLEVNNLTNEKQFTRASYTRDFNRNDSLGGKYHTYVMQAPLRSIFFTAQVTL
ncbi:MAG: TonB-dependent receptor [Rhodothermaceae bacterium]